MTVKELYDSVAQLGFETVLEDDTRFILAANRAIIQINRLRPKIAKYELSHFPIDNLLGNGAEPVNKDDEALIFVAESAKAYYFECNGDGVAIIERLDGDEWVAIDSVTLASESGAFMKYRGFIQDGGNFVSVSVRIRFTGEYVYQVKNIALYGKIRSANPSDIMDYSKLVAYDFASLTNDFASFVCPPIMDAGQDKGFMLDTDYFITGNSILLIPASVKGIYNVRYYREITPISQDADDETTNIDLDNDLCAILPNLVAAYVWADDEPTKAEYYLSLYREQAAEIIRAAKNLEPVVYRNKSGW